MFTSQGQGGSVAADEVRICAMPTAYMVPMGNDVPEVQAGIVRKRRPARAARDGKAQRSPQRKRDEGNTLRSPVCSLGAVSK